MGQIRRSKGSGTIHQRQRDGLWCAQVHEPGDGGKRRRRTIYGATREAVEQRLAAEFGITPDRAVRQPRPPTTLELARAKATHTPEEWAFKVAVVGRCVYCASTENLVMDHATPISRGGDDSIGNVVPACAPCNMSKGTSTAAEYLVDLILAGKR